ncbi:hypothetical protein A2W54_02125 [Candidatus Giovannonibacteria bacterium RIFCSPHIGHO2_02_43_13]|uniref:Thrombospondin type 3 repeat-containing domain protein n=1 Tax=Candidatus Giovannonibacteria bacterium RIFCSPHIGHO2_02_43_13 TaxID=1798330 RepID=A0A1F5WUD6_9BACT|nr:MAG: Thrombospondin type 3 repeat-containing domain protein [Parcubacteria group bacterium GW2011_GWA2_44_13]OGF73172.1 MAG: hypothetical protein A3E06_04330 [Candidatus Giovannonibacteria bacterium RIFCSPHIGHO2_12_FULL_44_42]OGF79256.1 MAG: hypothetical protein A2W54_02125 [Candidatus Giovannonibacteria bacterium RIFCSPHIGHO2_02_43_13]OGF88716.1 MAG: hypothetical protein A3I94_01390 [Candidatus Giovannonibacteria bacterium RIFCSPLOWO2_02_FULL_43_54]
MKRIIYLFFSAAAIGLFCVSPAFAAEATDDILSAFRKYKELRITQTVPSVIEISFGEYLERFDFAVVDISGNSPVPYYFRREIFSNKIPVSAAANISQLMASRMTDENTRTYAEFNLTGGDVGVAEIVLRSQKPIVSSSLNFLLDDHVAMPNFVEIRARMETGAQKIVVANSRVGGRVIDFPRTVSDEWHVAFRFSQPLRISEISLAQENAVKTSSNILRFLSQPGSTYRIYFDADRSVKLTLGEAGNLASNEEVVRIPELFTILNPIYKIADIDNDGLPDIADNCVSIANSDQTDENNNGKGDACDDFDRDGPINSLDNCPNLPNYDQKDADGDKIGDVCDKEESRITEQYPWIPWVGIGFAGVVLIILFAFTAMTPKKTID